MNDLKDLKLVGQQAYLALQKQDAEIEKAQGNALALKKEQEKKDALAVLGTLIPAELVQYVEPSWHPEDWKLPNEGVVSTCSYKIVGNSQAYNICLPECAPIMIVVKNDRGKYILSKKSNSISFPYFVANKYHFSYENAEDEIDWQPAWDYGTEFETAYEAIGYGLLVWTKAEKARPAAEQKEAKGKADYTLAYEAKQAKMNRPEPLERIADALEAIAAEISDENEANFNKALWTTIKKN